MVDNLIITACCLHNILRDAYLEENNTPFYNIQDVAEVTQINMVNLTGSGGFSSFNGLQIRDKLKDYFSSQQGAVIWQEKIVNART